MSLKELRKCATEIGIDTTTLVERDDYVNALLSKRTTDETSFKARKRKHEEDEAAAEVKRRAKMSSEAEESAKREALEQVNIWATHADLRLFLHRCGMKIDQHGRSTKRLLQKSYRQAMLRFHPDRARQNPSASKRSRAKSPNGSRTHGVRFHRRLRTHAFIHFQPSIAM